MNSGKIYLTIIVMVAVFTCCTFSSAASPGAGKATLQNVPVHWESNLNTAHRKSITTDKPLLILFESDKCIFCKKLKKETIGHPKMAGYINKTFIPVQLNINQNKRIAKILGVKKLPTTVILSPEADMLGMHVGFEQPVNFFDIIAAARKKQDAVRQVKYTVPAR